MAQVFPEWFQKLSNSFLADFHSQSWIDLELRCLDQEVIRCHSLILALASPLVRKCLNQNPLQDEILSISIPEVRGHSVESFVQALYSGRLPKESNSVKDISRICRLLNISVWPNLLLDSVNIEETSEIYRTPDGDLVHVIVTQAAEDPCPRCHCSLEDHHTRTTSGELWRCCDPQCSTFNSVQDFRQHLDEKILPPEDVILMAMELCTMCHKSKVRIDLGSSGSIYFSFFRSG